MTFINNLTTLFAPVKGAVLSKPVFRSNTDYAFNVNGTGYNDEYTTNPMYSCIPTEAEIKKAIESNEFLKTNAKKYGLKINMDILEDMV